MKKRYRTKFEKIVYEGLNRTGQTKEWLADQLKVTTQTLENYFRGGEVKPATRYYIGTLLDIPEFVSGEPQDSTTHNAESPSQTSEASGSDDAPVDDEEHTAGNDGTL